MSACVTLCLFNVFVFLLVNAMIWTGIMVEGVISGPLVVKNRVVNVKISFKQVSQTLPFAILPHCLPVCDHFFLSWLGKFELFFFFYLQFHVTAQIQSMGMLNFSPSIDSLRDVIALTFFIQAIYEL